MKKLSRKARTRPRRRRGNWSFTRRVALEALIADLAASFVDLAVDSPDAKIHQAFDRLLDFFRLDRVSMWEFCRDRPEMVLLHHRRSRGTPPPPTATPSPSEFEWIKGILERGESICIRSIDEPPEVEGHFSAALREQGVRSWLALPLRSGGHVIGALVFVAIRRLVHWDQRLAARLQTVADIFGNALARERAEHAWHRTEALETSILNSLHSHVVVIDREGVIVTVNKKWAELAARNAGPKSRLSLGENYLEACAANQCVCREKAGKALRGIREVLDGSRPVFEMEYQCPDQGEPRWFLMTASPLAVLEGGAVIVHRDITARKHSEMALRESEQRFRTIADEIPVVMWMREADSDAIYVNKAGLEITGWRAEDFTMPNWLAAIHPDDFKKIFGTFTRAMAARQKYTLEYRYRHASGQYRWMLACSVPRFRADGTFAGYVGVGVDNQELKEAEHARHAMAGRLLRAQEEERSRVARELHDDIAQRLALLTIKLQQLEQATTESEQARHIAEARKSAKQLSLDVTHLSHTLHSSYLENLGLAEAVRSQCQECASLHHVAIDCRVGELPKTVDKDIALSVFRVAQEALRNIVKHSRATRAELDLSADEGEIRLWVTDNGVGFDPDTPHSNQGIGLMSMKERLRLLGGDLTITSEPSHGTRLEARCPVERTERRAHPREQELETVPLAS